MSHIVNDQMIESVQMWCEQYGKRLSDVLYDGEEYFLELNDDVKDYKMPLPKNYQEMDLFRFIK